MDIPDLVGQKLDVALDIIKKKYPKLEYEIINYDSPKSGQGTETSDRIKRIVRQKFLKNKKLELVVFSFKEEPDVQGKWY